LFRPLPPVLFLPTVTPAAFTVPPVPVSCYTVPRNTADKVSISPTVTPVNFTVPPVPVTCYTVPPVPDTCYTVPPVPVTCYTVPKYTADKINITVPTVSVSCSTVSKNTAEKLDTTPTVITSSPLPTETSAETFRQNNSHDLQPNVTVPTVPVPSVADIPAVTALNAFLTTHNRPHISVKMFDAEFMALVDTGVARSYVGAVVRQLCLRHDCTPLRPTVENAKVANGSKVDITKAFRVKLTFEGLPSVTEVLHYLPGLTVFMVLGMDILEAPISRKFTNQGCKISKPKNSQYTKEG